MPAIFGRSKMAISGKCYELGWENKFKPRRKEWTDEEKDKLKSLVLDGKLSFRQMSKQFNRTPQSLQDQSRKMGLIRDDFQFKKYSYNQDFFETPNVLNCYVAGFYAADGCIQKRDSNCILRLDIARLDLAHMEMFREKFNYDGKIVLYSKTGKSGYISEMNLMILHSAHKMTDDLEKHFGLIQNKTFRIPPPNIFDKDLIMAYILGLLDGDGCVYISNQNTLCITYTSASLAICEWMYNHYLSLNLKSLRKTTFNMIRKQNANTTSIQGARAVDFMKRAWIFIEKHNLPVLARKWKKTDVLKYIQDFEQKYGVINPENPSNDFLSTFVENPYN
jgi:hypothetical protein